jgi:4-hydroxy-3-methylbut-2-enyl diphosphate reductase
VIDATCPLVTKVHVEVLKHARAGDTIVLIGHEGHDEVIGTMGHAPERVKLVGSVDEARQLQVEDPLKLAYVTQTTLSVDETLGIIEALRERFPALQGPKTADICYATQNRQDAVKALVQQERIQLVLVVGSENSSNSRRLVEVAQGLGAQSHLIEDERGIDPRWLQGVRRVGLTAGASAPEDLVHAVVTRLTQLGGHMREREFIAEDVTFPLPAELTTRRSGSRG